MQQKSDELIKFEEAYSNKIRELLPKLEILDGFNKAGEEIVSDEDETEPNDDEEDDDDMLDEEGEVDQEDDYGVEDSKVPENQAAEDREEDNEATKATGGNPSDDGCEKRQKLDDGTAA